MMKKLSMLLIFISIIIYPDLYAKDNTFNYFNTYIATKTNKKINKLFQYLRILNNEVDIIMNNLTNCNSYGYKRVIFRRSNIPLKQLHNKLPRRNIEMILSTGEKRDFSQGSIQTTGIKTDLAIAGDGFFIVAKEDRKFYTRTGTFGLDKNGFLIDPSNGLRVQGWMVKSKSNDKIKLEPCSDLEDIKISLFDRIAPQMTSNVSIRNNLDSRLPIISQDADEKILDANTIVAPIDIYDIQGRDHRLSLKICKSGNNKWTAAASLSDAEYLGLDVVPSGKMKNHKNRSNLLKLRFLPNGILESISDDSSPDIRNQGLMIAKVYYRVKGDPAIRTININFNKSRSVKGLTQFASPTTFKAIEHDGYGLGYLADFNIDSSGTITGIYSNGVKSTIGNVALALFKNQHGLTYSGQNLFKVSDKSGQPRISRPPGGVNGRIFAGTLEMSNVDLTEEYTNLAIVARIIRTIGYSIKKMDDRYIIPSNTDSEIIKKMSHDIDEYTKFIILQNSEPY